MTQNKKYIIFSWSEVLPQRVAQGSGLDPRMFNVYHNDLLYLSECIEVCSLVTIQLFIKVKREFYLLLIDLNMADFWQVYGFKKN